LSPLILLLLGSICIRLLFAISATQVHTSLTSTTMPSSKGKPTDPKLREQVKDEVKQETNKDGGGKGQMSAWKVCAGRGRAALVEHQVTDHTRRQPKSQRSTRRRAATMRMRQAARTKRKRARRSRSRRARRRQKRRRPTRTRLVKRRTLMAMLMATLMRRRPARRSQRQTWARRRTRLATTTRAPKR
jgi:hypothetical protein